MTTERERAARIAALNDQFRTHLHDRRYGKTFMTDGVASCGAEFARRAMLAVMAFDRFDAGNDPYGEHDFGSVEIDGHKLFWKIDYFDKRDSDLGAEEPTDPGTTERVLTIMLAEEY